MRSAAAILFLCFWIPIYTEAKSTATDQTRVLFLGDSLSIGEFGKTFDRSLRGANYDVHSVVAGGASPYYWLKSYQSMPCTIGFWEKSPTSERRVGYVRAVPKLEDLVGLHKPDVVIVQTGINLYATLRSKRRSESANVAEVTSLIEQMCYSIAKAGATSYWILPPHSHEDRYPISLQNKLCSIMTSVVDKYDGATFDSQAVTRFESPYPATDGIHYGPVESRKWAEIVAEDFVGNRGGELAKKPVKVTRAIPVPVVSEKPKVLYDRTPSGIPFDPTAEVELDLELLSKSTIDNPSQLDYANALGVYEYKVLRDIKGNYPYEKVRVAHGIVFRNKYTGAVKRQPGDTIELKLAPLSKYSVLKSWQIKDDLTMDLDLTVLYTPKLD